MSTIHIPRCNNACPMPTLARQPERYCTRRRGHDGEHTDGRTVWANEPTAPKRHSA